MTAPQPKRKGGQLLTPIIVLIMGVIMTGASVLQTPLIAVAGIFGIICLALGIGGLYFYNKDKKIEEKKPKEDQDLK